MVLNMFDRIKILTLLQLSTTSKLFKKTSGRKYRNLAVNLVIIVVISLVASLAINFIKNFLYIPVNDYFMIFLLVVTQVLGIITATIGLMNDMYHAKDNSILFSLPVTGTEVYISKLVVFYINEFTKNLFFIVPLLIGFGFNQDLSILYFFNLIPIIIILPMLSVSIAALIAIPTTYIKNYLKKHNWVSFVIFIVIFVVGFYFLTVVVNQIKTPIRIVQLFNQFIISLTMFMQSVAAYSSIYTVIGKLLYDVNVLVNYLILFGTITVLLGLNYFISIPVYFHLMSQSGENTTRKSIHSKPIESNSLFFTFFKKEFLIAKRSPNELLMNYSLLIALPIFMYVLNYIYMGINRSTMGNQFVLIFNVMITLLIVTGSSSSAAGAISKEGYEFVLLKTAPYNTSKIAWAKLAFNLIITTLVILISFIIFAVSIKNFNKVDIWLLYFFVNTINISQILWSFQLDIVNPKLSDYAETGSLANNSNLSKALSNGIIITIFFTVISTILFLLLNSVAWILLLILGISFLLYRFNSFKRHLNAYFMDIEY